MLLYVCVVQYSYTQFGSESVSIYTQRTRFQKVKMSVLSHSAYILARLFHNFFVTKVFNISIDRIILTQPICISNAILVGGSNKQRVFKDLSCRFLSRH